MCFRKKDKSLKIFKLSDEAIEFIKKYLLPKYYDYTNKTTIKLSKLKIKD